MHKKYKNDILLFIENKKTSDEFKEILKTDTKLQEYVLSLKLDISNMENIKDSPLQKNIIKSKARITIEKKDAFHITDIFLFTKLSLLEARSNENKNLEIYTFNNIEIHAGINDVKLIVHKINNKLTIEKNDKIITNISKTNKLYFKELESGYYNIMLDDYQCSININIK